ncbi:hypothetical protein M0R45_001220 [Rubus argutus]|uniref:Dienelactone hydrolase domain-containing protein n=1 Tax=Rubus argutus TaxID=59490 RepID=A0AAW1VLZ1_RUBAR
MSISDVFGYESQNLRKLADKVAAAGFSWWFLISFMVTLIILIILNLIESRGIKLIAGCEDAKPVLAALKSQGVSAIGAAGFCWGGNVAVKLAKSNDIKAAVILHPGQLKDEDIHEVKVHTAILGAEMDRVSPPELKQFGEILSVKSEIDSFVKIFPGVAHGWTMRYNAEDESAVKSAEEAHLDMLNWFIKYVK